MAFGGQVDWKNQAIGHQGNVRVSVIRWIRVTRAGLLATKYLCQGSVWHLVYQNLSPKHRAMWPDTAITTAMIKEQSKNSLMSALWCIKNINFARFEVYSTIRLFRQSGFILHLALKPSEVLFFSSFQPRILCCLVSAEFLSEFLSGSFCKTDIQRQSTHPSYWNECH